MLLWVRLKISEANLNSLARIYQQGHKAAQGALGIGDNKGDLPLPTIS